jgi:D-glycero-beta-D-manno-heptose 1-phosphate adenylyltransferase
MRTATGKILGLEALLTLRARWRARGKTVAWTNGCFDLLHAGHARSLQAAAALGDVLVVGVNSDASVRRLKGPSRPVVPEAERAGLVAALGCVDAALIFGEDTPERVLALLRPDVHCKGADYAPPLGQPIPERALVEGYGGKVEFLPLEPGLSTTSLIDRLRADGGPTFMPAGTRAAVLLDRDGTLIEDARYPRDPEQVRLLPGAAEALCALRQAGFLLAVVSTQSGVGRGIVSDAQARAVHGRFAELLAGQGISLCGAYYCPHAPQDGCACRKPSPALLLRALCDLGAAPGRSFLVGDEPVDAEAARRAGCAAVLLAVPSAQTAGVADFVAARWEEIRGWITERAAPRTAD